MLGLNILPTTPEDYYWLVGAIGSVYFLYKELKQRKRKRRSSLSKHSYKPSSKVRCQIGTALY
jgi:hypothetical protein